MQRGVFPPLALLRFPPQDVPEVLHSAAPSPPESRKKRGRFVLAEFLFNGVSFHFACLFAPNRNPDRDDFFRFVIDKVDPAIPTVVAGDLNAVFDRSLDRRGFRLLRTLFDDCCIVDTWNHVHPLAPGLKWMKPDGSLASRIDLIGCPISWLHHV